MKQYTVKAGDTLSLIARDQLGDINLWQAIAKLNNITNPNLIYPGQQLNLNVSGPGASANTPVQGTTSSKTVWIIGGVILVLIIIGGVLVAKGKFKMPKVS